MAGWVERLGKWLEGAPSSSPLEPTLEAESEIRKIIGVRIKSQQEFDQLQKKHAQDQETERQAKILEARRLSLIISQEASIDKLLEGARRGLLPLYPNAEVVEEWSCNSGLEERQVLTTFLRWGKEHEKSKLKVKSTGRDDEGFYHYVCFESDGFNNQLSLVQANEYSRPMHKSEPSPNWVTLVDGFTRIDPNHRYHPVHQYFTPGEWGNTDLLTKAIIRAVENPVLVSWSSDGSGSY